MSSAKQNLSDYDSNTIPTGKGKRVGIAVSEWNKAITFSLLEACVSTLKEFGITENDIDILIVPGTFELPFAAKQLATKNKINAVIAIGCVIKGETDHDIYINTSVANALQQLNITYAIPFIFGVLTPNNEQQAIDRAGGKHGNKGTEAAITALKMMAI